MDGNAEGNSASPPARGEDNQGLQRVFVEFGRLLEERLSLGILTTEDTIRYTLYIALTSSGGLRHTDLTLEHPHPTIPKAKIDTIVSARGGRESIAFEFKYDRANPGGSNPNCTQRAAKALNDLFRLVRIPGSIANSRYFVYLTDREMAGYFRNPANRLHDLFELAEGGEHPFHVDSFGGLSRTLTTMVAPLVADCVVTGVFAAELPGDHSLRIFRVSVRDQNRASALA